MGCGKIRLATMNDNFYKTNSDNLPVVAKGGFGKILKISGMPEKPKAHSNKRAIKHENIKKVFTHVLNSHSSQNDVHNPHELFKEPYSEHRLAPRMARTQYYRPSMTRTEDSREPDLEKFSDLEEDKLVKEGEGIYNKKEEINTYEQDDVSFRPPTVPKIIIAIEPPEEAEKSLAQKNDTSHNIPELNQPQFNAQSEPKKKAESITNNFSNLHINAEAQDLINYEEDVPCISPEMKPSHPADLRLCHEKGENPAPVCISPPVIQDSVLSRADTDSQFTAPGLAPVERSLTSEEESLSHKVSSTDLHRV